MQNMFFKKYWFWKNKLKNYNENSWLGFCQYRRYWLKEGYDKNITITRKNLKENILNTIPFKLEKL